MNNDKPLDAQLPPCPPTTYLLLLRQLLERRAIVDAGVKNCPLCEWGGTNTHRSDCPFVLAEELRAEAASRTGQAQLTCDQARDIATQLLDGTHCPKHGMAWEECCLGEVSLELACKIMAALRGENFSRFSLASPPAPVEGGRCGECGHETAAYLVDGVCRYGIVKQPHNQLGICGHRCDFSRLAEPNYCPTCQVFCVLPNHCDNCGGSLIHKPINSRPASEAATPETKRDIALEFIDFVTQSQAVPEYVWQQMRLGARLWCVELGGSGNLEDLGNAVERMIADAENRERPT